ncbi:MAG: hypothetical protein DMD35_04580 [Gemmatimonadetes bacterium]|nr:MAG: hypothetical protein DMD35_04580 [Gemmatimonadota bacterium]
MVGWFDPGQLVRTAVDVVISAIFARNSDRRVLDALSHPAPVPCDLSSSHDELWLDYVADTGDGWNSTYAVAHALAQPTLDVTVDGERRETRRGDVLVFGGDAVYPVASRDGYQRRLVGPYRTALPASPPSHPTVFAVAGNHDWYDSLVAFTRLFCTGGKRTFAGWRTHQTRSYFAIKLPHEWWLIGTDVQLESDIDDPQLEYFRGIAATMGDDDRIILCTAEPNWITEQRYRRFDREMTDRNLPFLEQKVFGNRVAVFIAGDLHHYRRHADAAGRQKITAGGGGAFLYPTHVDLDEVRELEGGYTYRTSYPPPERSKALSRGLLRFARFNPSFGWVTALFYLLFAMAIKVDIGHLGARDVVQVLHLVLAGILNSQIALLWGMLLLFGFYFFTDTHDESFKRWGGLTHALAHLTTAFLLGWFGSYFSESWLGLEVNSISQILVTGIVIVLGGFLIGPTIMGLYLFCSMHWFGRHADEFSALKCEDWKSWVRMHVSATGELRIYALGIDAVPREWAEATPTDFQPSLLVPDDRSATAPKLVDYVEVTRAR